MAIKSCGDKRTEAFIAGERIPEFQAFASQALKAIARLQSSVRLRDLRNPPGNRFEALQGDRAGQYSIRINDQWRLCFRWMPSGPVPDGLDILQAEGDATDVEIVDYH